MSVLVSAILILGAVSFIASPAASAGTPTQRLGFWLQESNSFPPAQTFFNTMFLTPPYPSTLMVMIFGIQQDEISGFGCSTSAHYTGGSASYWGQVAKMADSYPSIRLIFDIYFDPASGGSGTYGLSCFDSLVNSLGQYPSVYGLGVEGEYTSVAAGMTEAEMQTAMNDVTAIGKLFVNYYAPVAIPSGGYDIVHTNFPSSTDPESTLQDHDSHTIGIDSGYYYGFPFPGSATCPISPRTYGVNWNQCVVNTEISAAATFSPATARQFLELDVGFSSSGSFTGVSGLTTNQVWDNPVLRNWIWTSPSYQSSFILSTAPADPPTTAAATTSQSVTTTSSATTSKSETTATTVATSSTTATATTTTTSSIGAGPFTLSTYVTCPAGLSPCGVADPVGTGSYAGGAAVTLTAYPYGGFEFKFWTVCSSSCQTYSTNPLPLTLGANTKATATFATSTD